MTGGVADSRLSDDFARGRGGLAEVGRPDLRGPGGTTDGGGEDGDLAMVGLPEIVASCERHVPALPPVAIMAYERT